MEPSPFVIKSQYYEEEAPSSYLETISKQMGKETSQVVVCESGEWRDKKEGLGKSNNGFGMHSHREKRG